MSIKKAQGAAHFTEGHHIITQSSMKRYASLIKMIEANFQKDRPGNIIDMIKSKKHAAFFGVMNHSGRTLKSYEHGLRGIMEMINASASMQRLRDAAENGFDPAVVYPIDYSLTLATMNDLNDEMRKGIIQKLLSPSYSFLFANAIMNKKNESFFDGFRRNENLDRITKDYYNNLKESEFRIINPYFTRPFLEGMGRSENLPELPGLKAFDSVSPHEGFDPAHPHPPPPPSTAAPLLPPVPPMVIVDSSPQPLARSSADDAGADATTTAQSLGAQAAIDRGGGRLPGYAEGGAVTGPAAPGTSPDGASRRPPNSLSVLPAPKAPTAEGARLAAEAPNMDGNASRQNDGMPAFTPAGRAVAAVAAQGNPLDALKGTISRFADDTRSFANRGAARLEAEHAADAGPDLIGGFSETGMTPAENLRAGGAMLGFAADMAASAVDVPRFAVNVATGGYGDLIHDGDAWRRAAPDAINALLWTMPGVGLLARMGFGIARPIVAPMMASSLRALEGAALGAMLLPSAAGASAPGKMANVEKVDPLYPLEVDMYRPEATSLRPFETDTPPAEGRDGSPPDTTANLTHIAQGNIVPPGTQVVSRDPMGGGVQLLAPSRLFPFTNGFTGRSAELVPPIQIGFKPGVGLLDRTLGDSNIGQPILARSTVDRDAAEASRTHTIAQADISGAVSAADAPHRPPREGKPGYARNSQFYSAVPSLSASSNPQRSASSPDPSIDVSRAPHAHPFFGLMGPLAPDDLLPPILRRAAHQRDAERAVLPTARPSAAEPRTLAATVDFDHGPLLAAIDHVDTLHRKLQGLRTVAGVEIHHKHRHEGEGGVPGALRNALNGNFGSDGRAFS